MLWVVWIALGVGLAWIVLTAIRTVRQVRECFRSLRRAQGELLKGVEALAQSADRLAAHGEPADRLAPALARLQQSQARLSLLAAAADSAVGRFTALLPRK